MFGALLAAVLGAPALGQDHAEPRASIRVRAQPASAWQGQVVTVELGIEVDAKFFQEHGLQLHRQRLGLPIEVDAKWLTGLEGLRRLASDSAQDSHANNNNAQDAVKTQSFSLGGTRAFARSNGADGKYLVSLRYAVDVAGRFALEAPTLRYAYATRFDVDLFGDRKPVDRKIARVHGDALELVARPLPKEGRPAGFAGAVGNYTLRAEQRELDASRYEIEIAIRGDGDFARLTPPRLAGGQGVHVRGQRIVRSAGQVRSITEVAILDPEDAWLPAASLEFFEPKASAYRRASTRAFVFAGPGPERDVEARPGEARGEASDPREAVDPNASREADPRLAARTRVATVDEILRASAGGLGSRSALGPTWLLSALSVLLLFSPLLLALALLALRFARARRLRRAQDPATFAARVLQKRGTDTRSLEQDFCAYLARRIHAPISDAWRSDLRDTLVARGVQTERAEEARLCLHALARERYAEAPRSGDVSAVVNRVRSLVRELEAERCA